MGVVPKKEEVLESKKETVKVSEELTRDLSEDRTSEEIEAELNHELEVLGSDVPEGLVDFLDASVVLETNLRNIKLLDLKIEETKREIALEGYKGEKRNKTLINDLCKQELSYRDLRRTLIKETELVKFK